MLRKLILCLIVTVTLVGTAAAAAPAMLGNTAPCDMQDPLCGP